MIDVLSLTAEQILAIAVDEPERLFDRGSYTTQWRKLRSRWHDDKPTGDRAVFQHLTVLFNAAAQHDAGGSWNIPGEIHFTEIGTGKEFAVKYRKRHTFELGEFYVGNTVVAYALTNDNADLFKHGVQMIKSLRWADPKFQIEGERHVPKLLAEFATVDRHVVVIKKDPDTVLLRDLLTYFKGEMDSKHVAWVVSRLYNINCLLDILGVVHADISPDTCFVSPEDHRITLLGGWWYAQKQGALIKALPPRTLDLDVIKSTRPTAETRIASELILSVGRELLGDLHGTKLMARKALQRPMLMWLRHAPKGDPVGEYRTWYDTVLQSSFGKRKFIKLDVPLDEIYGDNTNLLTVE